ncbi:MAG TPA: Holliday junction resolvase-like protein [Gaiellaceae bacterium]|nr:Holliday junction resolvase-like protein [Gaiellaceae bacterium]
MTAALATALIAAVLVIVWLGLMHVSYRARFTHTETDLERARKDSLTRSKHVVSGKVQEHLLPFFPELLERFNPRDARFLGSPIDFVVFDGLDEGNECRGVVLVEVKTGRSSLSKRERHVRDAVEAGRISYELIRLPGYVETEMLTEAAAVHSLPS